METKDIKNIPENPAKNPAGKPKPRPTVTRVKEENYREFFENLSAQRKKAEEDEKGKNLPNNPMNNREDDNLEKATKAPVDTPRQDNNVVDSLCVPLSQPVTPDNTPRYSPTSNHHQEEKASLLPDKNQPSNAEEKNSGSQFYPPIFVTTDQPTVFASEPKISYIKNYFRDFLNGEKNEEYDAYLKVYNKEFSIQRQSGKKERPRSVQLNLPSDSLLTLFEQGGERYFELAHAAPFCLEVRKVIMEFEKEYMEYEKPWLRDWLWEQCHDELFCLKYLCKKSADLKNNACLVFFIYELVNFSQEAVLPSFYHEYKSKLKRLNEERHTGKHCATLSMKADENLLAEKIRFIDQSITIKELRDENAILKETLENIEAKFDKKLEATKAELRSEFLKQNNHIPEPFEQPRQCTIL